MSLRRSSKKLEEEAAIPTVGSTLTYGGDDFPPPPASLMYGDNTDAPQPEFKFSNDIYGDNEPPPTITPQQQEFSFAGATMPSANALYGDAVEPEQPMYESTEADALYGNLPDAEPYPQFKPASDPRPQFNKPASETQSQSDMASAHHQSAFNTASALYGDAVEPEQPMYETTEADALYGNLPDAPLPAPVIKHSERAAQEVNEVYGSIPADDHNTTPLAHSHTSLPQPDYTKFFDERSQSVQPLYGNVETAAIYGNDNIIVKATAEPMYGNDDTVVAMVTPVVVEETIGFAQTGPEAIYGNDEMPARMDDDDMFALSNVQESAAIEQAKPEPEPEFIFRNDELTPKADKDSGPAAWSNAREGSAHTEPEAIYGNDEVIPKTEEQKNVFALWKGRQSSTITEIISPPKTEEINMFAPWKGRASVAIEQTEPEPEPEPEVVYKNEEMPPPAKTTDDDEAATSFGFPPSEPEIPEPPLTEEQLKKKKMDDLLNRFGTRVMHERPKRTSILPDTPQEPSPEEIRAKQELELQILIAEELKRQALLDEQNMMKPENVRRRLEEDRIRRQEEAEYGAKKSEELRQLRMKNVAKLTETDVNFSTEMAKMAFIIANITEDTRMLQKEIDRFKDTMPGVASAQDIAIFETNLNAEEHQMTTDFRAKLANPETLPQNTKEQCRIKQKAEKELELAMNELKNTLAQNRIKQMKKFSSELRQTQRHAKSQSEEEFLKIKVAREKDLRLLEERQVKASKMASAYAAQEATRPEDAAGKKDQGRATASQGGDKAERIQRAQLEKQRRLEEEEQYKKQKEEELKWRKKNAVKKNEPEKHPWTLAFKF